jgi:acyl-CoA synthetase (AMP-forming)/AMP-acid ligase II
MATFDSFDTLRRRRAAENPAAPALSDADTTLDRAALDAMVERVAAALQRDGVMPGQSVAVCAASAVPQALVFLGALRAGAVPAPIPTSATAGQFTAMVDDCGASILFVDAMAPRGDAVAGREGGVSGRVGVGRGADASTRVDEPAIPDASAALPSRCRTIALDDGPSGEPFTAWITPPGSRAAPVDVAPEDPFDIIYSSGTTGTPKGIVHPQSMRAAQVGRAGRYALDAASVMLLSTPLCSNTTLVAFLPALAVGARVHLMGKFDAGGYLRLASELRATHTMLVPVQYRRLMAHADFDCTDLHAFRMKLCTSAPFAPELKADVLARWPGGLMEIYGMTEGGGSCFLDAHLHPHKLHTVGRPAQGHDIRLIDEAGRELAPSPQTVGEIVGRSVSMMTGYHGRPAQTREAEWFDAQGQRFIRTGDIGRFDEDGFLILMDRRKDLIISGGFNLYPSDLEAVLRQHPAVADAAVFGVPSAEWGETPVGFIVLRAGSASTAHSPTDRVAAPAASGPDTEALGSRVEAQGDGDVAESIRLWANERLGRTQRLSGLRWIDELPRSAIGKVLRRELRERWLSVSGQ